MGRGFPSVRVPALAPNLSAAVRRAVGHLAAGGLVIAPTECAYGIFASLRDPEACARIAELKGRGEPQPLPVVVAGEPGVLEVAAPPSADEVTLMRHFWPGPLTIVLTARSEVPETVTGGTGTIGIRIPPHPVAAWLALAAGPLTATSANPTGASLARTAAAIDASLLEPDVLVVDGGPCPKERPSTVVRVVPGGVRVLREGPITASQLGAVMGLV